MKHLNLDENLHTIVYCPLNLVFIFQRCCICNHFGFT